MINADDPPPLDAPESESPEALVRALRELGREQPSAAALRATGERLQQRLHAPPVAEPDPVHTTGAHSTGHALLAGRVLMAALTAAIGIGSLLLVRSGAPESAPTSATPAPSSRVPSAPDAPSALEAQQQQRSAPLVNVAAVESNAAVSESTRPKRVSQAHSSSRTSTTVRRVHQRATNSPPALGVTGAPPATQAEVVASEPQVRPATQAAPTPEPAEQPPTQRPALPREAPAPPGELTLLLEARKHARHDPAAVLRWTAEHVRRFPEGVLAPEREVLTIEALRALGRNTQADERLRQFRVLYPDSFHTKAVTTGTTR